MSVIQLSGGGGSCTSESSVGGLRISALALHPGFLGWQDGGLASVFVFVFVVVLYFYVFPDLKRSPELLIPSAPHCSFQYQLSCSLDLLGVSSAHFIFAWRGFLLEASWRAECRWFSVVRSPVVLTPWNLSCTADTSEFRLSRVHSTASRNCVSNYRVELNSSGSRVCVVWSTWKKKAQWWSTCLECARSWLPPHRKHSLREYNNFASGTRLAGKFKICWLNYIVLNKFSCLIQFYLKTVL